MTFSLKTHYCISELAAMKLPRWPTSRQGWHELVIRECWPYVEVKIPGGKKGIRHDYYPSVEVMKAIRDHYEIKIDRNSDQVQTHDMKALLLVADAASVLLLFVDAAMRREAPLRADTNKIAKLLHERLDAAGYTARNQYGGHHERIDAPVSLREFIG